MVDTGTQCEQNKVKKRLGNRATEVKWIVSDILGFQPTEK
jgi:hypothetical protein